MLIRTSIFFLFIAIFRCDAYASSELDNDDTEVDMYVWDIIPVGLTKDGSSISIVDGDRLELNCTVVTEDQHTSIQWFKGASAADSDMQMLTTSEDTRFNTNVTSNSSRLIIEPVRPDDRAYYKCIATNDYANASSSVILVRVKDKLAALWPFLGIVGEVILLCTIICLYEKSRPMGGAALCSDTE